MEQEESLTEYNLVESLEQEFQDTISSLMNENSVDSNRNSSVQYLSKADVVEEIFEIKQKTVLLYFLFKNSKTIVSYYLIRNRNARITLLQGNRDTTHLKLDR